MSIILDGETVLLGILGMLIAAVTMANILLALLLIDQIWRRRWKKKLERQRYKDEIWQRIDNWGKPPVTGA